MLNQYLEIFNTATAVIFDYDGTIAKIPIDWSDARRAFRHNFPDIGKDGERLDQLEFQALKAEIKPEAVFFTRNCVERFKHGEHEPRQEIIDFLKLVTAPKYIISNNLTETVEKGLEQLGIRNEFADVIGVDKSNEPKPSPGALTLLPKEHQRTDVIVVGDSNETDKPFAQNAGLRAVIV